MSDWRLTETGELGDEAAIVSTEARRRSARPTPRARVERALGYVLAEGRLVLIALTALAFGTVEYWSIGLFSVIVLTLLLVWGAKQVFVDWASPVFPDLLVPILLWWIFGILQALSWPDSTGQRQSLSLDPESTWQAIEVVALLIGMGILTANTLDRHGHLRRMALFLTIFGFGLSLFGLLQYFSWNGRYFWLIEPSVTPSHPFASFVNHNHFAGFVEMIAPIPVALIVTGVYQREKALLAAFAAVIMSVAIFVSLSRGGMISLAAGLMVVFVLGLARRHRREDEEDWESSDDEPVVSGGRQLSGLPGRVAPLLVPLLLVVAIGTGILWVAADEVIDRVQPGGSPTVGTSSLDRPGEGGSAFYQNRGFIWSDTWRIIQAHWGLGVGLGAYATAYSVYCERDRALVIGQAHNDYLQVLAEGGVIAGALCLLFLGLLLRSIRRALAHPRRSRRALALGATGGITALLVHSVFDFNLQLISNSLLFLTLSIVVWWIGQSSFRSNANQLAQSRGHFRHE